MVARACLRLLGVNWLPVVACGCLRLLGVNLLPGVKLAQMSRKMNNETELMGFQGFDSYVILKAVSRGGLNLI